MNNLIDLSGAKKWEPVPAGQYSFKITKHEIKTGKESGVPYDNFEAEIRDGDFAGEKFYFSMFPKSDKPFALWQIKSFLLSIGEITDPDTQQVPWEPSSYLGKIGTVRLKTETYSKDGVARQKNAVDEFVA